MGIFIFVERLWSWTTQYQCQVSYSGGVKNLTVADCLCLKLWNSNNVDCLFAMSADFLLEPTDVDGLQKFSSVRMEKRHDKSSTCGGFPNITLHLPGEISSSLWILASDFSQTGKVSHGLIIDHTLSSLVWTRDRTYVRSLCGRFRGKNTNLVWCLPTISLDFI